MSESEWMQHSERSKKKIFWFIGIIVVLGIIVGVFIRNNSDILLTKKTVLAGVEKPALPNDDSIVEQKHIEKKVDLQHREGIIRPEPKSPRLDTNKPKTAVAPPVSLSPDVPVSKHVVRRESVEIGNISCKLIDPSTPILRISLLLFFDENTTFRQELLLKRDDIKVMVQKILSTKSLDDITVEVLRKELLVGCNAFVENGKITDVEFKEFRINKVE